VRSTARENSTKERKLASKTRAARSNRAEPPDDGERDSADTPVKADKRVPAREPDPRRWNSRVGDLTVYTGQGVAVVEEIGEQQIAGESVECIVLRMVGDRSRILIPRGKVGHVGLREVMERGQAEQIWKILRTNGRRRSRGVTWSRQFRAYQEKLRGGCVVELAEVLRDLQRLRRDRELSFGEHRVLDTARTLLIEELSAAQETDAKAVEEEIKATAR